jgi:hypothetical protein
MNRSQLVNRVRSLTRDFSGTTFRTEDVQDFLNEGIDRLMQLSPIFESMQYLEGDTDIPTYLPKQYHSLLSIFASARLFAQDERAYQATTLMNEFELKLEELRSRMTEGTIKIFDPQGVEVDLDNAPFYVEDNYFEKYTTSESFDYPEDEDIETDSDDVLITIDGGEV